MRVNTHKTYVDVGCQEVRIISASLLAKLWKITLLLFYSVFDAHRLEERFCVREQ